MKLSVHLLYFPLLQLLKVFLMPYEVRNNICYVKLMLLKTSRKSMCVLV